MKIVSKWSGVPMSSFYENINNISLIYWSDHDLTIIKNTLIGMIYCQPNFETSILLEWNFQNLF